jgi:hypothetical protein
MSVFFLKFRPDRIGTEILSIFFQFFYCYKHKFYIKYDSSKICFKDSIFIKSIFKLLDDYNASLFSNNNEIIRDLINIPGPGETDMCYGMGLITQILQVDMLSFFKTNFYDKIHDIYEKYIEELKYTVPFDSENDIVIHLRLDDQWWESDYDGHMCSSHYINLINNSKPCLFTNGPNNKYNKQNPLSKEKIKRELNILQQKLPGAKIVIIASPLTQIPDIDINYDLLIQSEDYNYDLFLLSRAKNIILSRSNFALASLFFGNQKNVHMPLWGHFSCAGFGTKYDNCKFNYFY